LGAPSLISSRFAHGGPRTPAVARGGDAKWTLNVELRVDPSGATVATMRSPVGPDAERCLVAGMANWQLGAAGAGRAMLLLSLDDGDAAR
jgi:hypothetical protein